MEEKNNLICPICGAPTRVYMGNPRKDRLCATHANELKAGKIIKCEECSKYHQTDTPCECKKTNEKIIIESDQIKNKENNVVILDKNNKSKCILCGKQTDGLIFCPSCYYKYKEKELLIKITNCTNIELLDDSYEGKYECKDGHIVKSKAEREIDNYLFENGIFHAYEKELPYGPNENEILKPDFYLPNYLGKGKHVYIEHWGYNENNIKYTNSKKFKMPIYHELCKNKVITLINTYEKSDMSKIDTTLYRKLNIAFIKENESNFEEE